VKNSMLLLAFMALCCSQINGMGDVQIPARISVKINYVYPGEHGSHEEPGVHTTDSVDKFYRHLLIHQFSPFKGKSDLLLYAIDMDGKEQFVARNGDVIASLYTKYGKGGSIELYAITGIEHAEFENLLWNVNFSKSNLSLAIYERAWPHSLTRHKVKSYFAELFDNPMVRGEPATSQEKAFEQEWMVDLLITFAQFMHKTSPEFDEYTAGDFDFKTFFKRMWNAAKINPEKYPDACTIRFGGTGSKSGMRLPDINTVLSKQTEQIIGMLKMYRVPIFCTVVTTLAAGVACLIYRNQKPALNNEEEDEKEMAGG